MSRIHFVAIRGDRLIRGIIITVALLGISGYLLYMGLSMRAATPVPKALLLHSIPASTNPPAEARPQAVVGSAAPDFTLKAAGADSITLSSMKGKPVILYFWASWCSFCRDDMPGLQKLLEEKKEANLTILAINLLEKEELVKAFGQQFKLTLPLLLDTDGVISTSYQVRATPTYMFIDKEGILRAQVVGRPRPEVFERNLALILEEEPAAQPKTDTPKKASRPVFRFAWPKRDTKPSTDTPESVPEPQEPSPPESPQTPHTNPSILEKIVPTPIAPSGLPPSDKGTATPEETLPQTPPTTGTR